MDKYDIALLRRLRIISDLIDVELNRYEIKTTTLNQLTDGVTYTIKLVIMYRYFKLPLETIFLNNTGEFLNNTDEQKKLDLKITHFIENNYMNKFNEYYHNVNTILR
jgi:hypothetical protein